MYYGNVEKINRISERYTAPISKEEFERFRPIEKEFYDKFCPEANSTFKDTKEFIAWENESRRISELFGHLSYYQEKKSGIVVDLDKNDTKSDK